MRSSILVTAVVLAAVAVIAGCGRPAPTTSAEGPEAPATLPEARLEDELLLDEMKLGWLNAAQAWYDAGNTDLSLMHVQLQRVEEARQSLRALEKERRRFLAASEVQYRLAQFDPFALNHALQMIENDRQRVLDSIDAELW